MSDDGRKVSITVELETADLGEADEPWDAWAWAVERNLETMETVNKAEVVDFTVKGMAA